MAGRTQTADLLKGIAALLMIQVHILELFASEAIFNSTTGKILLFLGGPLVAPVFLLFLGYFIAASQKTTVQLIIRGLKTIALGFALNIALNLNLIISVSQGKLTIDLWPYILGVDILQNAGLSIIIIALLKKLVNKNLFVPLLLSVSAACLGELFLNRIPEGQALVYTFAFFYGDSWWSYFPILPWLSYSFAGITFYKLSQQFDFNILNSPKAKIILGVLFFMFIAFTVQYAVAIASNLQAYYHHGIIFYTWVIVFLFFYGFFIAEIDQKIGNNHFTNYLKWLGKNITVIYVIQWVIIGNIATEIYKTASSPGWLILSFALILAASSLLCYAWMKLKNMRTKTIS